MLLLLQLIIFGHVHKWETKSEHPLFENKDSVAPYGKVIYCECEKCGIHRRFDLKPNTKIKFWDYLTGDSEVIKDD